MDKISEQIEFTRERLNRLIKCRETITEDNKLLELSIELDGLINQYLYNLNQTMNDNSKL